MLSILVRIMLIVFVNRYRDSFRLVNRISDREIMKNSNV